MGFIVSLLIIAIGAILTWGVNDTSPSVNLDVIGVVLMGVGIVGFILTLFFWESWWGPGAFRRTRYASAAPDTTTRQRRGAADAAMWSRKRKCRPGRRRSRLRPPARRLRSQLSNCSASSISASEIVSGGVAEINEPSSPAGITITPRLSASSASPGRARISPTPCHPAASKRSPAAVTRSSSGGTSSSTTSAAAHASGLPVCVWV